MSLSLSSLDDVDKMANFSQVSKQIEYRRFELEDTTATYRMFRESIIGYLRQVGLVDTDETPDLDKSWKRQQPIFDHLTTTASEDWIAETPTGIVGWARSVERDGHLQLTHFFVDPAAQGSGVGRGLLGRAFPMDRGRSRSVLATLNPLALGLYLKFGVSFRGLTMEFIGRPDPSTTTSDLEAYRAEEDDLNEAARIDRTAFGFDRTVDLKFLAKDRPLYIYRRRTKTVGYAFGSNGDYSGPAGVLNPSDLPLILSHLETLAAEREIDQYAFMFPAKAHNAVKWALEQGYRIDPFYEMLLADNDDLKQDRLLMTQPSFIW